MTDKSRRIIRNAMVAILLLGIAWIVFVWFELADASFDFARGVHEIGR